MLSADLDSVDVIGCAETVLNADRNGGVIQQLKELQISFYVIYGM